MSFHSHTPYGVHEQPPVPSTRGPARRAEAARPIAFADAVGLDVGVYIYTPWSPQRNCNPQANEVVMAGKLSIESLLRVFRDRMRTGQEPASQGGTEEPNAFSRRQML